MRKYQSLNIPQAHWVLPAWMKKKTGARLLGTQKLPLTFPSLDSTLYIYMLYTYVYIYININI